jgi:hypothetical protein
MSLTIQLDLIINYLHQVRKVEDYLLIDMYFPQSWKILKKFVVEDRFVNMGTVDENLVGMSFVSELDEKSLTQTQNNIIGIINYNLEREQKESLFEEKINELRGIFEKQSLDNLKSLKFDLKNPSEITFSKNGKSKTNPVPGEVTEE